MSVDLVNAVYRRPNRSGWICSELVELLVTIHRFMTLTTRSLSPYQSLNWEICKLNALTHLIGNLQDTGGVKKCRVPGLK